MHNNFWKKCFSVFVALLMIFSNAQNLVYAEGDEHSKPLNENASSLSVSLNVDGAEIKSDETVEVNYSQSLEMNIAWNFANGEYPQSTEDKLTYQIPANIHATDSSGPLMDGNVQVGTYTITNNTITIQYNDENFIHGDGRKGTLRLSGSFDNSQLNDGQGGQTSYEFPGAGTITVKMKRNDANDGVSIKKTGGQVNKDNDGNLYADFIVAIHSKGDNTNVVFSDSMGSYMTLNGTVSFFSDEACNTLVQPQPMSTTVANSTFAYTISKMNDNETIYAKYRVNVDKKFTYNDDYVAKTNKASVKSKEHDSETSKEIQLQISDDLKYPKISKEGKKEADGVIAWTINFGKAGYDISGLKLKDILKTEASDDYLASQFKKDSFTVSPAVDGLTFDSLTSENGFTMPEGSNGEYTITYQTTYTQPTDSTKNYKVNNTITEYPYGDKWEYSKDSKNVTVSEKYDYVQKDFISFDEKSREALWKVTVHVPETGIADLKVADEIPDGMEFVNDSLSDLSKGVKTPTISEKKEKNKVYFSFGNVTKGTISFTYKTKITTVPEKDTTYNNKVRVYEKDKKLGTDEAEYELKFKQYLSKDADWNTFKVEGNDVSTSIPWVLTVSKLPADAKNVVITDTLPSNLKMVENSLMIKENWSNIIDSSNVDVELTKTSTGNVINFKLSDNLIELAKSKDIQIFFNTTYEDLSKVPSGSIEYKNTAQIKVDDYTAPAVSASRWQQYNSKDILNKDGVYNDGESFIHYTISVNKSSADLNPNGDTLTLEDTIGSEIDFQLGTLKINGTSATADQYSYDDTTRKITITIPDNQYAKITYDGYPNIAIGEEFTSASNNKVVLKGVDHVSPADKSFDKIKVHQSSGTSTYNGVSLTVYKQEKGVSAKALKGAKFALYEVTVDEGKETDAKLVSEKITGDSGYVSFSGLSRSVLYKLVETQAPDGYFLDSTPNYLMFKDATRATGLITQIKVGEKEYNVNLIDSKVYNKQIIVEDEPVTKAGSLKLTKHFAGLNDNQIDSLKQKISFDVQKKGSSDATHINLNDPGWEKSNGTYSYTLTNLQIGDYTVTETNASLKNYTVSTVYTYSVDGKESKQVSTQSTISVEDGKVTTLNITNTYEKQTTSYSVQKVWEDNINQQVRPDSVTVQLYADNNPVEGKTVVLSNGNNWEYEWTGLDEYNADGNKITYSAKEVGGNPNYSVSYDGNKITNTLNTTSYQVEKVWIDNNNAAKKRPSKITVQLQRQAKGSDAIEPVASVELNETNKWKHTFDNLLIANKDGKVYTYTVVEPDVNSYASDVVLKDKTFVITNTYQEQGKNITISKTDGNNVEIAGASLKLSRINDDSKEEIASWTSGQDGKAHVVTINPGTYYLEETSAPEHFKIAEPIKFEVAADGNVYIITTNEQNESIKTHCVNNVVQMVDQNIEQTSYSVQKVWSDNENAAKKRPSEITVQLQRKLSTEENYSNVGNVITLNNKNNWEYIWGALDATDQSGNSYTYQAVEVGLVNGYISSSVNDGNKTTINNTITSVNVSKVDISSLQELEGAHIQVLDGNKVVEEWNSTSETHKVCGLETNKLYTLHETIAPDGYTLASDIPFKLDDNGHVVVTDSNQNSISENGSILLKDALTSIRILKVDAATNTPLAGAHIQIKDGETIVQEFNSTEDNAGIQINGLKTGVVYTLHESSAPANYTLATDTTFSLNADGSINLEKTNTDFDINNGSIVLSVKDVQISKTTYSVQKEWVDNNNALNNRPSTIQVQLQSKLGDGEFTNDGDAITLSQDNNWTYKWNDLLSSNAEGTKYTYQAVEVGKSENYLDPSYRYDDSKKTQIITNKSYPVVEISKINVLGDEIQGAVLTLVDTNKNEVARWTSGSEKNEDGTIKPHYVQVAPGTYTLHEESTPDNNYVLAQDITFTVNENGVVTMNDTVVDHVTMVDEYNTHLINVSKVDISGNEIAGASMKITGTPTGSESKITPIEWVSGSDGNNEDGTLKNHVVSLQPGNYTLEETAVPDGNVYVKAANINFTVNVDGTVKVADNEAGDTVTMVDYYSDHGIVISKQDVNGAAVKGALLKLFDKENNEIASWETDGITDHQVEVQPGTYTLHEEATPDNNYVLAQNITFTVNEKGKALINGKEVEKVVMVDTFAPHDVVISKTDLNGKELKGAKLEVTGVEEGGGEIEKISWISDGNTKNISVKPGTYILHETATPDNNYVLAQDITFKVDSEGTISVDGKPVERVTMVDDYNNHPVEISKTDVGGKELAGAQLSVVDTNGITIDSWTSSAKIHKVTVKPGTYTLYEDLSPVGYKIAKDITFDVDIEGKVTVNGKKVDQVVMVDEDQTYDIAISKQDITNNKELPGAKLSLKDTKTNKVVETWTSASEAHVVTVVPSTYELSEVASPNGYEIAEKITFTVERDGTITIDGKKVETVIMQDQPTKPTVDTSDHNNIVFFGITGVISLGLAFMMLLTRKKIH